MTRILYLVLVAMFLTNYAVIAEKQDQASVAVAAVEPTVEPATTTEKPLASVEVAEIAPVTTITLTSQSSKNASQSLASNETQNATSSEKPLFQAASLTDLDDADVAALRLKMEERRKKVRAEIEALKQGLKPVVATVEETEQAVQPAQTASLATTASDAEPAQAVTETQPAQTTAAVTETVEPVILYIVTGKRVNARAGPTTNSEILARLKRGQAVRDAGESIGNWAKVVIVETEQEVWMHKNFIRKES